MDIQTEMPSSGIDHDSNFIDGARKLVADIQPTYEGSGKYRIMPDNEKYAVFILFFIEELERIPFHNEIGISKTNGIVGRPEEVEAIIKKLIALLKKQYKELQQTGVWDMKNIEDIKALLTLHDAELFKNEIYPYMQQSGICFSLDLLASYNRGQRTETSGIILNRYKVEGKDPNKFKVHEDGGMRLFLRDGMMEIDTTCNTQLIGDHIHQSTREDVEATLKRKG